MEKELEQKLRRLTPNQAGALSALILNPMSLSGIVGKKGKELGGILSALARNDLIQPIGREARQYRWEIADDRLKRGLKIDYQGVLKLLKQVAR